MVFRCLEMAVIPNLKVGENERCGANEVRACEHFAAN